MNKNQFKGSQALKYAFYCLDKYQRFIFRIIFIEENSSLNILEFGST
jgi:hypothetical protein